MAHPLRRAADAQRHDSLFPSAHTGASDNAPDDALGEALASLPAGSVWQASRLARSQGPVLSSGFAELDAALPGGGWPAGALIELLSDRPGVGEMSLLLPLMRTAAQDRWVVWIAPPLLPYAPALAHAGVPLSRLLLVRAQSRRDLLWAARQATTSGSCACVLAWPPQLDGTALRRLQLAAEESATPIFLFRPRSVAQQSSPAPLRLALGAHDDGLLVHVLKRRGPPLATPLLLKLHALSGGPPPAHRPAGGDTRGTDTLGPPAPAPAPAPSTASPAPKAAALALVR